MIPTIQPETAVSIDTEFYKKSPPNRGDIIALKYDPGTQYYFLSRIMGLPGEQILISHSGIVINGHLVNTNYSLDTNLSVSRNGLLGVGSPYAIPINCIFVLGDNPYARDSRFVGAIPMNLVLGKVSGIVD